MPQRRLPQVSRRRVRIMRLIRPHELMFLEHHPLCWACGSRSSGIDHIVRGSDRGNALLHREAWFAACGPCNTGPLTDQRLWPIARKLRFKLFFDSAWFDLGLINRIRDRAEDAITLEQIMSYAEPDRPGFIGVDWRPV